MCCGNGSHALDNTSVSYHLRPVPIWRCLGHAVMFLSYTVYVAKCLQFNIEYYSLEVTLYHNSDVIILRGLTATRVAEDMHRFREDI